MRVLLTVRRSKQSILKEVSPEYSLEGLILKLKLHLMRRTDSLEKTLMLGKIEGMRRRGYSDWKKAVDELKPDVVAITLPSFHLPSFPGSGSFPMSQCFS